MTDTTAILKRDPEGVGPQSFAESLFDPTSVGEALNENGWDSSQAIEILTTIARDSANNSARERMAAIKMLDDKSEKALSLHGVIRRISLAATQDDGETRKTLTADGLQIIKDGAARTLSTLELLEAGSQTTEIIDVDPVEKSHDARTDANVSTLKLPGPSGEHSRTGDAGGGPNESVNGDRCGERGPRTNCSVHGSERTNPPHSPGQSQDDDPKTIRGAENERGSRTPVQHGRGPASSGFGREGITDQREYRPTGSGNDSVYPRPTDAQGDISRQGQRRTFADSSSPRPAGTSDHQHARPARRVTPYTPGEARRRDAANWAKPSVSSEEPPTVESPRPSDGATDTPTRKPSIAARYLPASLAATGFPGDSTPDS